MNVLTHRRGFQAHAHVPVCQFVFCVNFGVQKQAILNASSGSGSVEQVRDQLSCGCPNTLATFKDAILKCETGRSMSVSRGYWAGMFDLQSPKLQQRDCTRNYESERFLNGTGDPCQVLKSHQVFVMGPCWNGFCYKAGDASHWSLNKAEPCRRNTHRTGVLCTQCKQGYQVMIGTEVCASMVKPSVCVGCTNVCTPQARSTAVGGSRPEG